VTDTEGLLGAVIVHEANIQDRSGGPLVIENAVRKHPTLRKIFADSGYQGPCEEKVFQESGVFLHIVRRPNERGGKVWCRAGQEPVAAAGFVVVSWRWIVERTFAWLSRSRRLSKDYEQTIGSAVAWIYIAMIRLLVQRLGV
jgi:putative transposase